MIRRLMLVCLLLVSTAAARAAETRIIKVLPHLLDARGRNALAPSLFERDAYQVYLRQNPEEISALRFDVQYKARVKAPMVLRLELRGSKMGIGQSRTFETDVSPRRVFSSWGALHLNRKTYEEIGNIVAWRATLWQNGEQVAEQQSFLW
jgi:hypothetical protein